MRLFPVTQFDLITDIIPWEVECILRSEMGRKRLNGYDGDIKHSKFEFGCPRYLKVPVSKVSGTIKPIENGSILSISIRSKFIPLLFPLITTIIAFLKLEIGLPESVPFLILSLALVAIDMMLYRLSVKKDIDYLNNLFSDKKNQNHIL